MKVLIIICEGAHDVEFVVRALTLKGVARKCKYKVNDYPQPFKSLFLKQGGAIDYGEMRFDVYDPPLFPRNVIQSVSGDSLAILYAVGGQDKVGDVNDLVDNVTLLLENAEFYKNNDEVCVDRFDIAFIFDADDEGVDATLRNFNDRYKGLLDGKELRINGSVEECNGRNIGCYIFHDNVTGTGTLETTLMDVFEEDETLNKSKEYIESFSGNEYTCYSNNAKRNKSIIAIAGQLHHPGSSMVVMIKENKLLSDDKICGHDVTTELLTYYSKY